MKAGLIPQAVDHYSMRRAWDPENPRYPLFLAMVQLKLPGEDNESAAVASLLRALYAIFNPIWPGVGHAGGDRTARKRVDLASQHLGKAIQFQPRPTQVASFQARIFGRQGKPDQAVECAVVA